MLFISLSLSLPLFSSSRPQFESEHFSSPMHSLFLFTHNQTISNDSLTSFNQSETPQSLNNFFIWHLSSIELFSLLQFLVCLSLKILSKYLFYLLNLLFLYQQHSLIFIFNAPDSLGTLQISCFHFPYLGKNVNILSSILHPQKLLY